jgi:hypothetical protein
LTIPVAAGARSVCRLAGIDPERTVGDGSEWLLSTMADRFETTAIGVYAVALRGRAALRLLTLAGGSGAWTVFLRNCPRPIFFANSDRCAA